MASEIEVHFDAEQGVSQPAVREELSKIDDEDVSKKSPISGGGGEVSVRVERGDESDTVVVNVEGHAGDWSKTSEQELLRAVGRADGVRSGAGTVVSGGYDAE